MTVGRPQRGEAEQRAILFAESRGTVVVAAETMSDTVVLRATFAPGAGVWPTTRSPGSGWSRSTTADFNPARANAVVASATLRPTTLGTVAVLLPGAFYTLQEERKPPVDLLRKHRVKIAIATDCNPGTSPLVSPALAMNMACTLFGLTPEEALAGMTINAARALGLEKQIGSLAAGKAADLCVWRIESLAELGYWIGLPRPERRIFGGVDS